ncbi:MAG TPA: type II toxin-antitoxin system VapC family toxin, partial [Pirellulales bacterium]|nr:type II toxin-antitoxin system VapC family toxin [Pirellulales bacterium]
LIWFVDQHHLLTPVAMAAISDPGNEILLSAASIWEMAIKVALRKLSLSQPYSTWLAQAISDLGIGVLPITVEYAAAQIDLPLHHRDPFDRMLIAQARVENVPLISGDPVFEQYSISRLW